MKKVATCISAGIFVSNAPVSAETFEEMCLRVSNEWGSTGDIAGQCSCLAEAAASNQSLADELTELAKNYSSDSDAYDAASDAAKAALDACAIES